MPVPQRAVDMMNSGDIYACDDAEMLSRAGGAVGIAI